MDTPPETPQTPEPPPPSEPALGTPERPDVVLVATLQYEGDEPGLCNHCFRVTDARRTRQTLYADVRPAGVPQLAIERRKMSTLLCQHFARKQDNGQFVVAAETLMCADCVGGTLVTLGLPADALADLSTELAEDDSQDQAAPEPPDAAGDEEKEEDDAPLTAPDFALFVHFSHDTTLAIASIVFMDPALTLGELLAEERATEVPPPRQRDRPLESAP